MHNEEKVLKDSTQAQTPKTKQDKIKELFGILIPQRPQVITELEQESQDLGQLNINPEIRDVLTKFSDTIQKVYAVYQRQYQDVSKQEVKIFDELIEQVDVETIYLNQKLKQKGESPVQFRTRFQLNFLNELKRKTGFSDFQLVGEIKQGKNIQQMTNAQFDLEDRISSSDKFGESTEIYINDVQYQTLEEVQRQLQQRVYKKATFKVIGSTTVNYPFLVAMFVDKGVLYIISFVLVLKVEQQQHAMSQQARFSDEFFFMLCLQQIRDLNTTDQEKIQNYIKEMFLTIQKDFQNQSGEQIQEYFQTHGIHFSQRKFLQRHLEQLQKSVTEENIEQFIEPVEQVVPRQQQLFNYIKEKMGIQYFEIYHETQDEIQEMFYRILQQTQQEGGERLSKDRLTPADIFIVSQDQKNQLKEITLPEELERQFIEEGQIIPVSLKKFEQTGEIRQKLGKVQPSQWLSQEYGTEEQYQKQQQQLREMKGKIQKILPLFEKQEKSLEETEELLSNPDIQRVFISLIDKYLETVEYFRKQCLKINSFDEVSQQTGQIFKTQVQLQEQQKETIVEDKQGKQQILLELLNEQRSIISKVVQISGEKETIQKYIRGLLCQTESMLVLIQTISQFEKQADDSQNPLVRKQSFLKLPVIKEQIKQRKNNVGLLKLSFIFAYLSQIKATDSSLSYVLPTMNSVKVVTQTKAYSDELLEQIQNLIKTGEGINIVLGFYTIQVTNIILINIREQNLVEFIGKTSIRMQMRYYSFIHTLQFEQIKQQMESRSFGSLQEQEEIEDENLKKQQLVLGRFQPITVAHKYITDKQLQENEQLVIAIVQGEKTSKDIEKNPFPQLLRKEMWETVYKNLVNKRVYITIAKTGYIPDIITQQEEEFGVKIQTIYAGFDRIISYKNQIARQGLDQKIRFVSVDEGVIDQRQTLVRELLKNYQKEKTKETEEKIKKLIPRELYNYIPKLTSIIATYQQNPELIKQ